CVHRLQARLAHPASRPRVPRRTLRRVHAAGARAPAPALPIPHGGADGTTAAAAEPNDPKVGRAAVDPRGAAAGVRLTGARRYPDAPGTAGGLRQREGNAHARAPAAVAYFEPQVGVVRGRDLTNDGQPKTAARTLQRRTAAVKALQHVCTLVLGNARPVVF